jgi:hypothetical protein
MLRRIGRDADRIRSRALDDADFDSIRETAQFERITRR